MVVNHQFIDKEYFSPNWDVNKLFIGTFNPECGEPLDYYRRKSNGFWKILNKYNSSPTDLIDFEFTDLQKFITNKKMGCVDVIKSVTFPSQDKNKIFGYGYSDSNLFTVKNYTS
jgi:hypothetical protein